MLLQLFLSFITALILSLLSFRQLLVKGGLDPALITYSNLFVKKDFWVARISFLIASALIFWWPFIGQLLLATVAFSFAWLLALLVVFSRTPTQPSIYYFFIIISTILLCLYPSESYLLVALCLYIIGELNLYFWRRHQKYFYDKWVARRAARIYTKYSAIFNDMPAVHRHDVLHVATTEDIARPAIVRLAERIYFKVKKPAFISTGIMQVRDVKPLSDKQSMKRGSEILVRLLDKMPPQENYMQKMLWISRQYNDSESYAELLAITLPGVSTASKRLLS